jgi:hypothetical protein
MVLHLEFAAVSHKTAATATTSFGTKVICLWNAVMGQKPNAHLLGLECTVLLAGPNAHSRNSCAHVQWQGAKWPPSYIRHGPCAEEQSAVLFPWQTRSPLTAQLPFT